MIGGKGGNAMSEEKRKPVLTGRKKQIFYTGFVYLLICFMTAGATIFLTKEKKEEAKEVSAAVVEEPKVNTGYASMETNPLQKNQDRELADAVEAYYQELSGKEAYAEAYDELTTYTKDGEAEGSKILFVRYKMKIRGIYTEVPGLGTLYAVKNKDGKFDIQAGITDKQIQAVIEEVSMQTDVQELFAQVEADYEQALDSDAMLAQAVEDLKNATSQ